jgi:molybdopterin molybdotransferase
VAVVERTTRENGCVVVLEPVRSGANIRRKGEEVRKGDTLLTTGTLLGPAEIGLCAAVGKATLAVHSRPRVALLCTGSELRTALQRVAAHEVRNSNGPAIEASLRVEGFDLLCNDVVSDDIDVLVGRLRRAAKAHDVIVLSGGVSVGRYDYVPEAVTRIGAKVRFHGVRMKPGKPVLYATLKGNRHIFGLPGNPLSAMNGFHEFVLPALRRLSGAPAESCRHAMHVPLGEPMKAHESRIEYVLSRLVWNGHGPTAVPVRSRGSADIASGCRADGMVILPDGVDSVPAGAWVEFRPWRRLP